MFYYFVARLYGFGNTNLLLCRLFCFGGVFVLVKNEWLGTVETIFVGTVETMSSYYFLIF